MDIFNTKKIQSLKHELNEQKEYYDEQIFKMLKIFKKQRKRYDKRISSIEEEMEGYKNYKTEKEILKESDEPWADFEVFMEDDGRVGVKMDWNKHFIQELKRQGINASSEEDMVSIYFASLVRETGTEMSEEEAKKYTE